MAQAKGFGVALAGLGTKNDALLRIHGVYEAGGSSVRTFQSMDEAVRWAEGRQLQAPTPEHPRRRVLIDDDGDQPRRFLLPQRAASLPGGRGHAARALSFDDPRSPRGLSTGLPLSRAAARYVARVVLESTDLEATEAALRDAGVKEVRLKAGEAAFELGEEGASFFCVVTGTLSLRQITNDLETGAFQERDGVVAEDLEHPPAPRRAEETRTVVHDNLIAGGDAHGVARRGERARVREHVGQRRGRIGHSIDVEEPGARDALGLVLRAWVALHRGEVPAAVEDHDVGPLDVGLQPLGAHDGGLG